MVERNYRLCLIGRFLYYHQRQFSSFFPFDRLSIIILCLSTFSSIFSFDFYLSGTCPVISFIFLYSFFCSPPTPFLTILFLVHRFFLYYAARPTSYRSLSVYLSQSCLSNQPLSASPFSKHSSFFFKSLTLNTSTSCY